MAGPIAMPTSPEPELSGFAKAATIIAVMLAMMLEMLDMTVVNVAMPHMMGSLGATADQIIWVLTSYMVSSAVVMPLTGYLSGKLGRRRLLLTAISGFMLSSAACGAATSLPELVAFRLIQGAMGATLAPLSQATMMNMFSAKSRGSAMGIWGLGMMVVPVMGPSVGGFLTDTLNWRWVFYVNVPLGTVALLMASAYMPDTPANKNAHTDWIGLLLLILAIGGLQLTLDLGNSHDWFNSLLIQALAAMAGISGIAFVYRCWDRPGAIVNLAVYKDKNFTASSVLVVTFAIAMFGIMTLLPLMLEQLMQYPAEVVGEVMAPRGATMGIFMLLIGRYVGKFDPRGMMFVGAVILAGGTFVYALFPAEVSPGWVAIPGILQGIGMSLFFIPSAMLAYDTLPRHLMDGATGLFSLVRTIGGSIGVAIIGLMLARRGEYHWQVLGEHVTPYNPELHRWLDAQGMTWTDAGAAPAIYGAVARQAQMLAFDDMFIFVSVFVVLLAPLVAMMRRTKRAAPPPAPAE
jgi:DHA2 family multidrug resistance protein